MEAGAEIVELRLDALTDPADLPRLVGGFSCRFIFTCRPTWEGGESALDDADRFALLNAARVAHPNGAVDIELTSLSEFPDLYAELPSPRIVSFHDFSSRPPDLTKKFVAMQESDANFVKIAWTARSVRDNLEAFELMKSGLKPTMVICMGEAGKISRILTKKFGGYLSFAALDRDTATAPGQVTISDLKRIYRWDSIRPTTKIYGVAGSPISHSLSPIVHNAGFDAIGFDGVYVPFLINEGYESFKAFMETFLIEEFDLAGLSITIPHKENALRYAIEKDWMIDNEARQIGALNTYARTGTEGQRSWRAFNTDAMAIVDTILTTLEIDTKELGRRSVGVIGAGGTGRAAAFALCSLGCPVKVFNRSMDRAQKLAACFEASSNPIEVLPIEELSKSQLDIYLNTTSLGMSPNVDESPFDFGIPKLKSNTLVFDCVYNPIETRLLRQSRDLGAKTVGGIEMFLRQAARQFEAWTGTTAPISAMRNSLKS